MIHQDNTAWHTLAMEEVFKKMGSSQEGLDAAEAKQRLKEYGPNSFQTQNSETAIRIFFRQLRNPLIYVLMCSAFFALALGKYTDSLVILSVVFLNTLIGFIQEYRANRIIRALAAMVPHKSIVIRQGEQKHLLSSQIVPGDVVFLQAGDYVPADLRLFFVKNLQCDESSLTGESLPVAKNLDSQLIQTSIAERKCMAFNGTYVCTGTGLGVVVATGFQTEFGKIPQLIESIPLLETPLSLTLNRIAKWITVGVLIVSVLLCLVGYLRGSSIFDSILAAVALAVAAIPEGLPAIITIASAVGVRRMARRQAIIRQLPAVEALGSTTVICTDKTGTLTHNEMTVQCLWTPAGFSFLTGVGFSLEGHLILDEGSSSVIQAQAEELIKISILCSDASLEYTDQGCIPVGDPTEIALVIAGRKLHLKDQVLRSEWSREDEIPFEAESRMMATLYVSKEQKRYVFIKGAPEKILTLCDLPTTEQVEKHINNIAQEGMRVLAIAKKEVSSSVTNLNDHVMHEGFSLLGLVGMMDPPRKEAYQAIRACHEAGITVKMVTGDHPLTARSIGQDLGLLDATQSVIQGSDLNNLPTSKWQDIVLKYHVFARVSPEHKLQLVTALQQLDHVVAMTGDGVNDAPALKRADIGIAMGIKGTAVAKEAADMVLADDNFASIEAAVEEGRHVYDNLIKSLAFTLPTSLGQALVIFFAVLFFPLQKNSLLRPMLPVQILWINLVVAVALALPLAFEIQEPDIMKRLPKKKTTPILNGFVLFRTFCVSLFMALGVIGLFLWEYHQGMEKGMGESIVIARSQTIAVTAMMLIQIFYLFHCRSFKNSLFAMNPFSNPAILLGVASVVLAQLAFIYLPFMNRLFYSASLDVQGWFVSALVALSIFILLACEKVIGRFFFKNV
ncbi:MAG: HAD-IC family P-type ATPase [Verrucomicrobia bacterium]|nr:HAD-IC family P-type ATPase [Verrucomicrobiota bacterium]